MALSDEVSRRDGQATVTRAQRARLDPALQLCPDMLRRLDLERHCGFFNHCYLVPLRIRLRVAMRPVRA